MGKKRSRAKQAERKRRREASRAGLTTKKPTVGLDRPTRYVHSTTRIENRAFARPDGTGER